MYSLIRLLNYYSMVKPVRLHTITMMHAGARRDRKIDSSYLIP